MILYRWAIAAKKMNPKLSLMNLNQNNPRLKGPMKESLSSDVSKPPENVNQEDEAHAVTFEELSGRVVDILV